MKIRILTVAGLALLAVPAMLAAQKAGAQASASVRVGAGTEAAGGQGSAGAGLGAAAGVDLVAASAAREGLPEAPVRRAAARARSRGASDAAAVEAAATAHAGLRLSREALAEGGRRQPSAVEIEAGAEALASGATRADLALLARRAPADRSLAVSLETLAAMRARGVESGKAAADVSSRLARGASDASIRALATGAGAVGRAGSGVGGAVRATGGAAVGVGGVLGTSVGAGAAVKGTLGLP
ncbi:MAG TPA: hypothetical protein VF615_05945 [Longimicrobiaceae bacterium]|jgi:hypothetical protein